MYCNKTSATFVCKEHACAVCGHNAAQTDAPSNLTCAAMKPALHSSANSTPVQSVVTVRLSLMHRALSCVLQRSQCNRTVRFYSEHLPSHSFAYRPQPLTLKTITDHHRSIATRHRSITTASPTITTASPRVIAASSQHHRPSLLISPTITTDITDHHCSIVYPA